MSKSKIIGVNERVPLTKGIPLSIQHTFAMFSASIMPFFATLSAPRPNASRSSKSSIACPIEIPTDRVGDIEDRKSVV